MKEKILAVIERLGVTEMTADIIIDIVVRGMGKRGGRPKKETGSETPTNVNSSSDPKISEKNGEEKIQPADLGQTGSPQQQSLFFRTISLFCELWVNVHGTPYEPTPADRNQLGRLLKSIPAELVNELPRALRGYLKDQSPFVAKEQGHSLRFFCTSGGFNKYRVAPVVSIRKAPPDLPVVEKERIRGSWGKG